MDRPKRPVKMVKVSDLQPYGRNARTHSLEQIKQVVASINEFGWTNPVLIDAGNTIIAGHARVEAAKQLGLADIPCICLDGLTEAQARAYVIADNKLALNAGWDEGILGLELSALKELGANLELTGFDAMELADIMLGKDVSFKEYDESAADEVDLVTCPECGHSFPK